MSHEPVHRKYHHHEMTFGIHYGFTENFVLPLSHDEVVHGKGSLFGRMPGDRWQKFANLRAYFGFMWTHPGKKLLFMGGEFAQEREWNHDRSLDWYILDYPDHRGVQQLVRDLNHLYRRDARAPRQGCRALRLRVARLAGRRREPVRLRPLRSRRRPAGRRRLQPDAGGARELPPRRAARRLVARARQHRCRRLWRLECRQCRRRPVGTGRVARAARHRSCLTCLRWPP